MDPDPALERHLREREESHLRHPSRSDPRTLSDLLADDFVEFGSSGGIIDRTSAIEAASAQAPFHFRIDTFTVRFLGECAALTTYRLSAWSDSEFHAKVTLRSSVWVQREARWQMVFHQGTPSGAACAREP